MFTQFFGNYLLNKGLVTPAQLSDALAVQKTTRLKLGVLAINAGYMTAEQVEQVHAEQQRVDKRIGDIACDMGYLTHEQVEQLLSSQGEAHLQLGQALVDMGAMTNAQFADALNSYKTENSLTDVDFSNTHADKIKDIIKKFYDFSGEENADMYLEYVTLLFKNIIRFIGDDFTPMAAEKLPSVTVDLASVQVMEGALPCLTVIDGKEPAYVGFASRYAGESLIEADEMTDAANGEFLNLHNGLFSVNVSNETGREIKLLPQATKRAESISGKSAVYRMPLVFPFGTVNFLIAL
ncbi:MAG: chemotaxis protein CheX [Huintestinicola sp.]